SAQPACDPSIDPNCPQIALPPASNEICFDGVDNNGDGNVDEQCIPTIPPKTEPTLPPQLEACPVGTSFDQNVNQCMPTLPPTTEPPLPPTTEPPLPPTTQPPLPPPAGGPPSGT